MIYKSACFLSFRASGPADPSVQKFIINIFDKQKVFGRSFKVDMGNVKEAHGLVQARVTNNSRVAALYDSFMVKEFHEASILIMDDTPRKVRFWDELERWDPRTAIPTFLKR